MGGMQAAVTASEAVVFDIGQWSGGIGNPRVEEL
jgi:hypothetical protein